MSELTVQSASPGPDPYDATAHPEFPHQDLNEVRPTASNLRRGRGWMLFVVVIGGIVALIAWDRMSKTKPAVAQQPVNAYGVGTIPLKDPTPQETAAEIKKVEEPKPGTKAKAPVRRKKVLGMSSSFADPSHKRSEQEVTSWNSTDTRKSAKQVIANQRKSVLAD